MDFKQTSTGKLNKRISLEFLNDPPEISATGEPVKSYTPYATVWAAIRTLTGRERNDAQQVQASLSHEFTIWYSSDVSRIKTTDRIVYKGRYFDIKDVRNVDELNIEIRMLCMETV